MEFIKKHPFVRLLIPLIAGILFQQHLNFTDVLFQALPWIAVFAISMAIFMRLQYRFEFARGVIITFGVLFAGLYLSDQQQSQALLPTKNEVLVYAKLLNVPTEKTSTYKAQLNIEAYKQDFGYKKANQKILAYFEKSPTIDSLKAGQHLFFVAPLNPTQKPLNPYEFDYSKYLQIKQIEKTVYLQNNQWVVAGSSVRGLKQHALNLRTELLKTYTRAGIKGDQLAILSALTLGYKSQLDASIKDAYSGAGAMHILAVSGLHVGIVYFVLLSLINLIPWISKKERLKTALLILALWAYALIAGLSPSVMRAATMFTFIIAGKIWNKRINVYNSLAASAFFLLLWNPSLIYEVGFQLSYAAVVGIVFFQPKIYRLVYVKNKVIDYAWQLTTVSMAAQIATLPITLYYFNQFPVYFWLSNIIAILSATALIYIAFLLFIMSPFQLVFEFIGRIISYIIEYLNQFIFWINQLPFAVLKHISLTHSQMFLSYLLIVLTTVWLLKKSSKAFIAALVTVLLFGTLNLSIFYEQANYSKLCVYQSNQNTYIQFISNKKSWWFINEKQPSSYINHFQEANKYWGVENSSKINWPLKKDTLLLTNTLLYQDGFFKFKTNSGFIIHSQTKPIFTNQPQNFNVLIVTGNPQITLADLPNSWSYDHVIVDGSVPPWKYNDWITPQTHITSKKGAFIQNTAPP